MVDHFFLWDNGSLSGRFQWPSSSLQPSDEPKTISFLEHPDFCHLCPILCTNFLVLNLCTLMYLFRPLQSQGADCSVDGFWQLPCNIGKRIVESFWIFSASLTTFRYLTPHWNGDHKLLLALLLNIRSRLNTFSVGFCIHLNGWIGQVPQSLWSLWWLGYASLHFRPSHCTPLLSLLSPLLLRLQILRLAKTESIHCWEIRHRHWRMETRKSKVVKNRERAGLVREWMALIF